MFLVGPAHECEGDRQDLAESRLDFGKKLSLRIEKEEKEMRGIHDSVETVNAAAAVFVSAESWVQQVTVPVSRHTPFLCFWFLCSAFPTWLFILGEDELLGSVCIGALGLMEMTGASAIQSLFLNLHFLCRMPLH
ncbi:hypothetical protein BHE74_00056519 [Ensete ventricosum]|nr:hypothetical protein BHE74_00056519 [Ensete ventricosum]